MAAHYTHLASGGRPSSQETGKKGKKAKEEDVTIDENLQLLLGSDKDFFPYVSYTAAWDLGAENVK